MIVHVLFKVKAREEEYEFAKDIASRIEDLLPSVQLAKRERRLLWHGGVVAVSVESPNMESTSSRTNDASLYDPSSHSRYRSENRRIGDVRRGDRDVQRDRSGSLNPASSQAFSRAGAGSSTTSGASTQTWDNHELPPAIVLSPCPDVIGRSNQDSDRRSRRHASKTRLMAHSTRLHCFVFTDVLILALSVSEGSQDGPRWRLLPGSGISRIIGVEGQPLYILNEDVLTCWS